tara:strand:- start:101 stop:511 length:411 start_codon:yes stop_codon:yes gene_type:complete
MSIASASTGYNGHALSTYSAVLLCKKVSMNFRVEPELRDRFKAAVRLERRSAAEVLREFMRGYISEVDRKHSPIANQNAWDDLKRRRRLANAKASIELEGYKIPDEMEAIADQFMQDEVSIDAVLAKADELALLGI